MFITIVVIDIAVIIVIVYVIFYVILFIFMFDLINVVLVPSIMNK